METLKAIVILVLSVFIWGGLAIPVFLYNAFKEKKYKIFSAILLFIFAVTLFFAGEYWGVFDSNLFQWFAFLLVASLGLYCCKLLVSSIKDGTGVTVVPYGPALVFGAFVVMFLL